MSLVNAFSPRRNRIKATHPHVHLGRARGLMEPSDPGYRVNVAGRPKPNSARRGPAPEIYSPLLRARKEKRFKIMLIYPFH